MANPSPMRVPGVSVRGSAKVEVKPYEAVPEEATPHDATKHIPKVAEVSVVRPRRLIRPDLPQKAFAARDVTGHASLFSRALHASGSEPLSLPQKTSHAEVFYLQKQAHAQKLMVFVLDDGEHLEGCIEWYDRNAIKIRRGSRRTLIYKSCIKYLYKAGEGVQI
jgi:sRNA-binding regulator protein Hfq